VAVDPEALFAAGSAVVGTGDALGALLVVSTAGFGANTGLDAAGVMFGLAYRSAAESLSKAATAVINALRHNGTKVQVCAANYSQAEAASTLGGGGSVLSPPGDPRTMLAPGPPGTLGPGEPPPLLWAVVQSFLDDVWPNGDVAGMHAAAGRWRDFGAAFTGMQGALNGSKSLVDAQHTAEGELIDAVLSQIGTCMEKVAGQCGKLAGALDDFANAVADAQHAIRDLLHRLGSLFDLFHDHDVISILDGEAIDEIKRIAHDINAVLHNLGREARATEQGIKLGMQVVDGLVQGMENCMRGQFTHFLGEQVGNAVATGFDIFVNFGGGVFKGAYGAAQGMEDLDPRWFLIDPEGATNTWMGMTKTGLLNELLHPQEAGEANGQMIRSLLHIDDWRWDRPGLGLGENFFDAATLVTGIGAVGAGTKGAAAAARGARASEQIAAGEVPFEGAGGVVGEAGEFGGVGRALGDIGRTSSGLTEGLQNLRGDLPRMPDPSPGGRPVSLPPAGSAGASIEPAPRAVESAPPATRLPESPTAGGSTVAGRPGAPAGPHGPVSVPAAEPHPPAPASTGRDLRASEPAPARVPVSGGGPPGEPAPAIAPAPSAPIPTSHTGLPEFASPSSRPLDLSGPHGDGACGLGQGSPLGDLPHGQPSSHGGNSYGPLEGGADHYDPADEGHSAAATDAMTSDDLLALADYTGLGSEDLNFALRSDAVDTSQLARIEAINTALTKLPAYDGPVFRGTDLPSEVIAQYQPGEVITEDAFLSTSTDPAVARSPEFEGNVEFRILSSTGRDISSFSMVSDEQEVLFRVGAKFYVLDRIVDPLTGKTIIEMIERPVVK
jgi:hypothetical protein